MSCFMAVIVGDSDHMESSHNHQTVSKGGFTRGDVTASGDNPQ